MQRDLQDVKRDIKDIVDTLKEKHKGKDKTEPCCTLLIGAGCSVKAGIPVAVDFVKEIGKRYPNKFARVKEKTYSRCMQGLAAGERHGLISEYIDKAKINWAHIGIAQLIKHGFVDRVLTVNFDPLIQRACALVGVFPAVYDFAASQKFDPNFIAAQSIFHLHGQRSGFVILNTPAEVRVLSRHLKPVFDEALLNRVCIVVGYSGENDPVFTNLSRMDRFVYNLYWVGYKNSEPAEHVRKELLEKDKDAFYVSGFDADDFFIKLALELKCFPPDFVGKPFSYLRNLIDRVSSYPVPGREGSVAANATALIQEAIDRFEKGAAKTTRKLPLALKANGLLVAGKYDQLIAMSSDYSRPPSPEFADAIAGAQIALANEKLERARLRSGKAADQLFAQAYKKYEAATKMKPDKAEALYGWGIALAEQARTKSGNEADQLFAQACRKYEAATKIKPDKHWAFNDWGNALLEQALTKIGKEADQLFAQSREKYKAAAKIKPDFDSAFYNWGNALWIRARTKSGDQAERLLVQACKKYEAAIKISPDKYWAFNNWGIALSDQAVTKSGKKADLLFKQAYEKYETATKIKPDLYDAFHNWGIALSEQAKTKSGKEADRLKALAEAKFEIAREISASSNKQSGTQSAKGNGPRLHPSPYL